MIVEQLVEDAAVKLTEPERIALKQEWLEISATELPEDLSYVYTRVATWIEYRRMEQAILEAATLLREGEKSLPTVRELVTNAAQPLELTDDRKTFFEYMGEASDRLKLWRAGDEQGVRIPTGLPALDRILSGGPTVGEVMYFLAPPKGAKTASLLRVALGAARRQFGVYLATYEMRALRMALRLDRMTSRSTREELEENTGRLERALAGMKAGGTSELYVEERLPQQPRSVDEAAVRINKIRRAGGKVDVAVLDYLNIMGPGKTEKEIRHSLPRISRDMAQMARQEGVLVWCAALVNRQAVNKQVIRKTDIAEAFEVIAVADGMIAICGTRKMIQNRFRRYYVCAAREEQDEVMAGDYVVDFARMTIDPANSQTVDNLLRDERNEEE